MPELMQIDYRKNQTYTVTANNAIGATTSTTLRTVDTISGDTAYVRKFGTDYLITQVTDIEDPVDANMTFVVKSKTTNTTLGSRTGGGAFSAGSTLSTAEGCYLVVEADGGNVTVLASITIDTDVDAGGLAFTCAAETVDDGNTLTLYLSDTGSTYYDSSYIYGGARHTPALNDTRTPYFTIASAYAALDSANDGVVVLDSAYYTEQLTYNRATTFVLAALGQTPRIYNTIGINPYNTPSTEYNNTTAVYFNNNGSDITGDGTWQLPYQTIENAVANRGSSSVVYGGTNPPSTPVTDVLSADITVSAAYNIESDHNLYMILQGTINCQYNDCHFQGIEIFGGTEGIYMSSSGGGSTGVNIYYCKLYDTIQFNPIRYLNFDNDGDINIKWNNISGSELSGIRFDISTHMPDNITIQYNLIHNNDERSIYFEVGGDGAGNTFTISHNFMYDNANGSNPDGLYIGGADNDYTLVINNNIIDGMGNRGAYIANTPTAFTMDNNIISNNVVGIEDVVGETINYTCFYNNTTKITGATTSNNEITADPEYYDRTNNKYGILPTGSCYKTDGSENDVGPIVGGVLISANSIIINGFIFEGNNLYSQAIYKTGSSDYTGTQIKWCTLQNYNGVVIDEYSATTINSDIFNCWIENNAVGVSSYGNGIEMEENIIKLNTYGVYNYGSNNEIIHDVFFNNTYGVYNDNASVTIRDNIFKSNTTNSIYSSLPIITTYCCVVNSPNSNVDITDSTNFVDDPLFIDAANDDFNVKSIENGNLFNSPCVDAASDLKDIGAYDVTRATSALDWRIYRLEYNPDTMDMQVITKNRSVYSDIKGDIINYGYSQRRVFPLQWNMNTYTSETQRKKIEYFNQLLINSNNGLSNEETIIRLHILPTTFIDSGTSATVSSSGLTLTDSTKSWVEDELRGWYVTTTLESGSNGTISASGKTLTSTGSFTGDDYSGYYMYYNRVYYYIVSNTNDALTLSDGNSYLIDSTTASWKVVKYFRINSCYDTVLNLDDNDSELISGSYDWFVDFIQTRVQNPSFRYQQIGFDWTQEHWKGGYNLNLEEIN